MCVYVCIQSFFRHLAAAAPTLPSSLALSVWGEAFRQSPARARARPSQGPALGISAETFEDFGLARCSSLQGIEEVVTTCTWYMCVRIHMHSMCIYIYIFVYLYTRIYIYTHLCKNICTCTDGHIDSYRHW